MKKTYEEIKAIQKEKSKNKHLPLTGVLENIRSLYNVGSIFRTADGAGFEQLVLTGYTGAPPSKEIEKTALGATHFIPWHQFDSPLDYLKSIKNNSTIVALEHSHKSIPYTEIALPQNKPVILVVGNEITGIENKTLEFCDIHTEIPMMGQKHSLNVSVAFGILAFHLAMLLKQQTTNHKTQNTDKTQTTKHKQ